MANEYWLTDELDANDAITVRVRAFDGEVVAEAFFPVFEDTTGKLFSPALGNPVPVPVALANARKLVQQTPYDTILIYLEDENLWQKEWGAHPTRKPSSLIAKPFRV
ncbi:hypothetical protein GFB56_12315 [Ensifer sp. T173]|uniref:Uncharacterized protein n=1 Tax=Ensifer canadensis TaxID=555315 RepID=A0AAW4FLW6_9HYPH|nr:hypothetical protein [Ensifer canadensis]MBM3091600.1 hypothetical protein [Ensifer canadensis]UBI74415.1 hypothetical protein J3R84_13040 [Ensifer canadensis]